MNPYITLILIGYCAVMLYAGVCYLEYLYDITSERATDEIDERLSRK